MEGNLGTGTGTLVNQCKVRDHKSQKDQNGGPEECPVIFFVVRRDRLAVDAIGFASDGKASIQIHQGWSAGVMQQSG